MIERQTRAKFMTLIKDKESWYELTSCCHCFKKITLVQEQKQIQMNETRPFVHIGLKFFTSVSLLYIYRSRVRSLLVDAQQKTASPRNLKF